MSTTISHQRAYSLPIEETYNINNDTINHKNGNGLLLSCKGHCNILNSNSNCTLQLQMQSTSNTCNICCCCNNNNSSGRCNSNKTTAPRQLQPVHQRTRSLPLTEETAISCINSNSPTNNHILNNNSVAGNHCNIILHQQQPQLQQQCCHHNSNHINMNNNNNNNNHSSNGAKLKSQSSSVIHYNNNNNYNSNSNKINCNCSCMFVGGNVVTTTNKGSLNNNCHLGAFYIYKTTFTDFKFFFYLFNYIYTFFILYILSFILIEVFFICLFECVFRVPFGGICYFGFILLFCFCLLGVILENYTFL